MLDEPSQGFWGFRSREKGNLFPGIWGESITFWFFWEQEKHFRELRRKVIFVV